jgi:hypothetical protein
MGEHAIAYTVAHSVACIAHRLLATVRAHWNYDDAAPRLLFKAAGVRTVQVVEGTKGGHWAVAPMAADSQTRTARSDEMEDRYETHDAASLARVARDRVDQRHEVSAHLG